jgi:homoserine O-acetyltransferase/O-succinyltransferase
MLFFLSVSAAVGQGELRYARVGDYELENGQVIRDCKLAYRTFGVLNADKSNAVLFPTWLVGTTQELVDLGFIGPGKLADSSQYFIIAVDSFGNGVSSSPSNSILQPGQKFPLFTVKDMVDITYLLLTRYLELSHLYGVIGISMGGMQTFQWMVSYPDFLEKAVAIEGSPRLTAYDLLLYRAELSAIENSCSGEQGINQGMKTLAAIHALHSQTPRLVVRQTTPEQFPQYFAQVEKSLLKYNGLDWAWQLKAIIAHDIFKSSGKSAEQIRKTLRARTLVICADHDGMVYPEPAKILADLLQAETLELKGDCGHFSFICERETIQKTVAGFMNSKRDR